MSEDTKAPTPTSAPSRRDALRAVVGGSALTIGALATTTARAETASHPKPGSTKGRKWEMTADIVIVGSGAAGSSAAVAAASNGASVIMLEKMPFLGGTTLKSDGVFWTPNNPLMRAQGVVDDRADALRYMVRLSFPTRYDPTDAHLGVSEREYKLIATFYDNASPAVEKLMAAGALKIFNWKSWDGQNFPDYYSQLAENKAPRGRGLVPDVTGHPEHAYHPMGGGNGAELLRQLHAVFDKLGVKVFTEYEVLSLLKNPNGEVAGVEVDRGDDAPINIRANKAVIFASGGFTHDPDLCARFLKGHIWGGCAAPGSTGDFIRVGGAAGARLGNTQNAWWAQVVVETALKTRSVPADVWTTGGDSSIQVNRFGKRFFNEKGQYDERTQAHFYWDSVRAEYPNHLGLMIWDERTHTLFPASNPIPPAGTKADHVIEGATIEELAANIAARLEKLAPHTGGVKLDSAFLDNLKETIARYNGYAVKGVDPEFARGETPSQVAFHLYGRKPVDNPYPNMTMHPIADKGPYYAAVLGAGTLDTKGGPIINEKAQVEDAAGNPIPGLYGAGNCIASPAGQAYWAGGGTIGPALTFGYIAGTNAAREAAKTV